MSQYELHSWCYGITAILYAIFALPAFITGNVDWWLLCNFCFFAAAIVINCVAPYPRERTENEKRLSDKATARTSYGLVIIIAITVITVAVTKNTISNIIPETITITVTKETISNINIFVMGMVLLAFGVQSLLLAVLLRRATKQNGEHEEPENDVWKRIKK
jgi:hypothetical protein